MDNLEEIKQEIQGRLQAILKPYIETETKLLEAMPQPEQNAYHVETRAHTIFALSLCAELVEAVKELKAEQAKTTEVLQNIMEVFGAGKA